MRTDRANWKLGVVYFCREDPRLVVRAQFPIGWAWNFANPKVLIGLPMVMVVFLLPLWIAPQLGVRSIYGIICVVLFNLVAIFAWAHQSSKDPGE